ncbi:MAG TPA: hypothetical protein VFR62_06610 [Gemmatimonadales bacterium]|nr:hypothetical protein [Gemmatimonadales bacterium]
MDTPAPYGLVVIAAIGAVDYVLRPTASVPSWWSYSITNTV